MINLKKKRNKKFIGYLLIIIGIAIPLYGFTNLTKSIIEDKAGYEKFSKIEIGESTRAEEEKRIESYNNSLDAKSTTIVDPFATDEFKTDYEISSDPDAIFAYLRIPKLDLLQPIRLDASNKHMAQGLAHVDGTSLPVGGKGTRSVIAGHRGYYQNIMFLNLDELEKGDKIFIERDKKVMEYEVNDKEIIEPSQWEKLNPIEDKDMVTLLTCDPFLPPRPHRLLVNCQRLPEKIQMKDRSETEDVQVKTNVKLVKYSVIAITLMGWAILLFAFYKFILFLKEDKK